MTKSAKKAAKGDSSSLVRAARQAVGDADEDASPLTKKEKRLMDQVRREAGRPTKEEIQREAKKLFK